MTRTNITAVALCVVAGTAMSVQAGGPVLRQATKPVEKNAAPVNTQMGKFATPANKVVNGTVREFKASEARLVKPSKMIVNGRSVPFTSTETLGSIGATDNAAVLVYNNWIDSGAGTNSSLYSGTVGTANTPINAALDDVQFGGTASGVLLAGYRLYWATDAAIPSADTYFIALQWYDGFNAAANPVNTNYAGFVATEWDAPDTGWEGDVAYRSAYLTSDFIPGDFATAGAAGALEWLALADDGTGSPDTVVYPYVTPLFNQTAPTTGTSSNAGFFFANNVLDNTASGSYPSPAVQFSTTSGPILSNLAVALVGFTAPGAAYGACCLPNAPTGGCVSLQQTICTTQGGVWKGSGTTCALANANVCSGLASGIAFNNGPISTGSVSYNGVATTGGRLWNEGVAEKHATSDLCIQNLAAYGWWGGFDGADDFTVPTGETWNVSAIKVYLLAPGAASSTPPLSGAAARLALWKGFPDAAGSTIVAGNRTTNRTVTTTGTNIYLNFSSADGTVPGYSYRLWEVNVPLPATTALPAGHYYWDIGYDTSSVYSTFVTVMTNAANGGTEDQGGGNGQLGLLQGTSPAIWGGVYDTPFAFDGGAYTVDGTCLPRALDFPFQVIGTKVVTPTCYANCDGSTGTPALTAADFTCFLTKFRANDSYANCDGSTGVPSLTAADFTCFLTKFRAGCP